MRHSLTASLRRPLSLIAAALALAAGVSALAPTRAGAAPLRNAPLVPFIVGGQEASIAQFPWQVFVLNLPEVKSGLEILCGGSILDATHILTAAHCVDHVGTTVTYPPGGFFVLAGASNVSGFEATLEPPAGSQERRVSRIRAHPYYTPLPGIKDDAAVLELSSPLELSAAANAQAIPLVAAGATPAPGTTLSVSGYGKEDGAEKAQPNGGLYSTTLSAMSSDACREGVGVNSAVLLCASGPSSSACEGDSGGPLTEGGPPVEVGIVDFGGATCPVGHFNGFTNLAAPEVRAFIEGSESPPVAARPTAAPAIRSLGAAPLDFSPLTCEPGTWSGSPTFTYTFQAENASAQVLQSGTGNTFTPPASLVGAPLVCIVQASNPGGVATYRSATSAPVAADTAAPVASVAGLTCHKQACTFSVAATDPNGAAVGVEPWVTYEVTKRCRARSARKRRGKRHSAPSLCHSTAAVILPVSNVSPGVYQASANGLPYRESLTFKAVATNAAGLKAKPVIRATTLHPPPPRKSKHHRPRSHRRKH